MQLCEKNVCVDLVAIALVSSGLLLGVGTSVEAAVSTSQYGGADVEQQSYDRDDYWLMAYNYVAASLQAWDASEQILAKNVATATSGQVKPFLLNLKQVENEMKGLLELIATLLSYFEVENSAVTIRPDAGHSVY